MNSCDCAFQQRSCSSCPMRKVRPNKGLFFPRSQPGGGTPEVEPGLRDGCHGAPGHHGGGWAAAKGHQGDPRATKGCPSPAGTPHRATPHGPPGSPPRRQGHCCHRSSHLRTIVTHCSGAALLTFPPSLATCRPEQSSSSCSRQGVEGPTNWVDGDVDA